MGSAADLLSNSFEYDNIHYSSVPLCLSVPLNEDLARVVFELGGDIEELPLTTPRRLTLDAELDPDLSIDVFVQQLVNFRRLCVPFLCANKSWYNTVIPALYEVMVYCVRGKRELRVVPETLQIPLGTSNWISGQVVTRFEIYVETFEARDRTNLVSALAQCPNIEIFVLRVRYSYERDLAPVLDTVSNVAGNTMRRFECYLPLDLTFAYPISFLHRFTNSLEILSLGTDAYYPLNHPVDRSMVDVEPLPPPLASLDFSLLHTLHLYRYELLPTLVGWLLTNLRHLCVDEDHPFDKNLHLLPLLDIVGPQLETLELRYYGNRPVEIMQRCPGLKELVLSCSQNLATGIRHDAIERVGITGASIDPRFIELMSENIVEFTSCFAVDGHFPQLKCMILLDFDSSCFKNYIFNEPLVILWKEMIDRYHTLQIPLVDRNRVSLKSIFDETIGKSIQVRASR